MLSKVLLYKIIVEDVVMTIVDVNKNKYILSAKASHFITHRYGSFHQYVRVVEGSERIRDCIANDLSIKMDCGTLVNPKNIVSCSPKTSTKRTLLFLQESEKGSWGTYSSTVIKEITRSINELLKESIDEFLTESKG